MAYTSFPKTPPGPAWIETMSPPNDEIEVSSETEVNGAAVKKPGFGVPSVTVTLYVAVLAGGAGVVIGVAFAKFGPSETTGARRQRSSSC